MHQNTLTVNDITWYLPTEPVFSRIPLGAINIPAPTTLPIDIVTAVYKFIDRINLGLSVGKVEIFASFDAVDDSEVCDVSSIM